LVKLAKMSTSIRGTTRDARRARLAVARTMSSAPLNKQRADDFVLAMAEAIANAVEHGTASESERVEVSVDWNNEGAHGTVHSDGSWKLQMPSIDRGRGLDIMRALADRVDIDCEPGDGTTVHVSMQQNPAKVRGAIGITR
jgi:anti-sigma regulatory factor (Ser/Thr protein kinase)